jgi:hypothetical protein
VIPFDTLNEAAGVRPQQPFVFTGLEANEKHQIALKNEEYLQ